MNGERLAEIRKDKKVTQKALAKALSVSATTISGYERGRNSPNDDLKVKLAKYFDISLDYLLGATDDEIKLNRSNSLVLPQDFPEELKDDVLKYALYLQSQKKK